MQVNYFENVIWKLAAILFRPSVLAVLYSINLITSLDQATLVDVLLIETMHYHVAHFHIVTNTHEFAIKLQWMWH